MNNPTVFNIEQIAMNETDHPLHPYIEFSKGNEVLLVNTLDSLNFYYDCDFFSVVFSSYSDVTINLINDRGRDFVVSLDLDEKGELIVIPEYADGLTYVAEDFIDFCVGCGVVQVILTGEKNL